MDWLTDPQAWIALATLTALEIVLGIDNIIFITVLVGRLPPGEQRRARFLGLGLARVARILLLLSITWVMRLTQPLFAVLGRSVSGRDLILLGGGLFLLVKATVEIHGMLEGEAERHGAPLAGHKLLFTLGQIALLDIVFSLDSVITAVGLAKQVGVMITAIVIAVLVMLAAAAAIGRFVESHPTFKMLAMSFLILVGVMLVADGLGVHVPKGYVYFAVGFSALVEVLNLKLRRHGPPVHLRRPLAPAPEAGPANGPPVTEPPPAG